jgi:hypothetical protein
MVELRSEAPGRRPAPLAVVEPITSRLPRVLRTGSHLAVPGGELAGDLKQLSIDRRRKVAVYELRVANDTSGPLVGFTYAVEEPVSGGTIHWSTVTVPPFTSVATPVELPLPRRGRHQRVVTELHADGARLTLDAAPPNNNGYAGRAAIALTVALIAGIISTTYAFARPHIDALVAPAQIAEGRPFAVLYALAPSTTHAQFSVKSADGRTIQNGTLSRDRSSFSLSLPSTPRSTGYDVTVSGANAFGRTSKVAHVLALAPPPPAQPLYRARAVALANDTVTGGDPIVVSYPRGSEAGDVKLLDQDGTERGAALVSKRGSSIVIAPAVTVPQDFRIVVDIHHGANVSESALPVRIVPAARPAKADSQNTAEAPSNSDASGQSSDNATGPQVATGAPISVGKAPVRSGEAILVHVLRFAPQMQVTLLNDQGEELQRLDVTRGEDRLRLYAPHVSVPTKVLVVATFAHGVAQDSVIEPVTISPR